MGFWKRLLVIPLIVFLVIATTPSWAVMNVDSDKLKVDGVVLGEAIGEREMEARRGTYLGVHFSVLFEGFWDVLGNQGSRLSVNAGSGANNNASTAQNALQQNLPANTAVKIQASLGGMNGARGAFVVTQVPGSDNNVASSMNINIQVIQVLGNSMQNLSNLLKW